MPPEWLVAGVVGRPHGLDGSFHVVRARPELLRDGMTVSVGGEAVAIARRAGHDARPIVRLEGHDGRDAAEALRGAELRVHRDAAPALGEGEWWPEQLHGCRVHDGGDEVGTVTGLLALPSCEALEVRREDGSELLVPLVADAVRNVDPDARRIDVDMAFVEGGEA